MRNFLILISFLAGTSLLPAFVLAQTTTGDVNPNASAAICVNLRNNLSRGTSNAQTNGEVSILQMFLQSTSTPGSNTPYLAGDPTGFFGILTENAAKRFQADQQLLSSGYVGPLTRDKIKSLTCNGGSTSANFSASPAIGLSPLPVIFTFQVEPHTAVRPIQYRTDFGDEQHNSATVIPCPHSDSCTGGIGSVSHTYTTPGTYTANLIKTVYNDCRATENMACAAWVSREENMGSAAVTVTQSETARTYLNFTASPTSGSAPLNVAFSLSRYIEGNLQLDFGDDTIRNTDDSCLIGSDCKEQYVRSHIYTTAGTYRAKLIRQIACITTPCVGDTIGIVTINVTGNSSTIRAGGDTPSTTTECTELTRDLSLRSTDAATSGEVSLLQLFLQSTISSLGTPYLASEPTGFFGQLTRAAVLLFQKDNGLELAGVVGPITRAKIKELSCVGTSSSSPTATLNSNNSKNLTVNTGDPITHTWNSTGGTSWRSTYTISGCAQAKGPLTWWNGNSANGSEVGTVSAGYEGCTWTLNYTVTGLGGTATDRVNITINPITSTTTECTELTRDLSLRSTDAATGGEVSLLQLFLQTTAWPTSGTPYVTFEPTGFFGQLTREAVVRFQRDNGISGIGFVGPLTRAKIKDITCSGDETGATPLTTPVVSLTATPERIVCTGSSCAGKSSALSWSVKGASMCVATGGVGWSGYAPSGSWRLHLTSNAGNSAGDRSVSPTQTTTYQLECTNDNSIIPVNAAATVTVSATAGECSIEQETQSCASGAYAARIGPNCTWAACPYNPNPASQTTNVSSFKAVATSVAYGGSTTLSWDVTPPSSSGTVCTLETNGASQPVLTKHDLPTGSLTTTTTYKLICSTNSRPSASKEVTVTVGTRAGPTVNIAQSNAISYGEDFGISWNSQNADSCTIAYSNDGLNFTNWKSGTSGNNVYVATVINISNPGTYVFRATCTASGNATSAVDKITHIIFRVPYGQDG